MEPLEVLDAALAQTRPIVAAVSPDELARPTPCEAWDVRKLLNHLFGAMVLFRDVVGGSPDYAALEADHFTDDPLRVYDELAAQLRTAWSAGGVIDGTVSFATQELPGGFVARMLAGDVVVHGWDVATATGQSVGWDQELAADIIDWQQEAARVFPPELRANAFGAEVLPPEGADTMARLVALVGRQP
jgi:uncharacterized protein (TIGR03086 family)